MSLIRIPAIAAPVVLASLLAMPAAALAQSAIIYGSLGNFDISNDTGKVCHGFQVDLDGVDSSQVSASFTAQRYGAPALVPYAGGVSVRWESQRDASGAFLERTLPHTTPWFPGQCYQWNPGTYQDSGCEHFGTGTLVNPTGVVARWLCEDESNPASLVAVDPPTAVPMPSYYVVPPVRAGNPPQVVVEFEAPEPAEAPSLYGDAQWVRVFVNELPREISLDELMADNPQVVPMNDGQLESDWDILQDEPLGGSGNRRRKRTGRDLAPSTRTVIRRIETWAFTGAYDPVTHEALCADGLCDAPAPDEVGELLSTQMSAVHVEADALVVTRSGSGSVDAGDKSISCGSRCAALYEAGTAVTLRAKPSSGNAFAGWTGACSGTSTSCTVAVNGHVDVGAKFVAATSGGGAGGSASLSVKVTSGKGSVSSNPAGIQCGRLCSMAVAPGTTVTLRANPEPGFRFSGWSGACTGTDVTCAVTLSGAASVQAAFAK